MPDRSDKTEAATPKRKREAREKGQVAKSSDLSPAVVMLTLVLSVRFLAPYVWDRFLDLLRETYTNISSINITQDNFISYALLWTSRFLVIIAPIFALTVTAALISNYAQIGFLFTTTPLKPDFSRLNPGKGIKRILSSKVYMELFKSLGKLFVVIYISYVTIKGNYPILLNLSNMELMEIVRVFGSIVYSLGVRMGMLLLFLALVDYAYQRFDFKRSLKMSKQEVKDEMKHQEGDPMIKARIRQKQRQMAMQRMMQEVPKADVIITNPIHLAVALKYDQQDMAAPKVLAKGQSLIAEKIKKIARENSVPIVEDKPIAQWLFKSVNVGSEIPAEIYQAVAEILAMVYRSGRKAYEMGAR